MAKSIMIQGTGSHVGKSTLAAALCRIFSQDGFRVAPFKAQNMALNSYVTMGGHEMGRAQAVQAFAARVEPCVAMNPVLLKPNSDTGAQVILSGKVVGNMQAREYQSFKNEAWKAIEKSYRWLEQRFDLIVIEGAGSPAEINLKRHDIANMRVARMADAPVILIGDIDRGGVFASLWGTLQLLTPSERRQIGGWVINKFRGDRSLLEEGLRFLEKKTRRPVLGVMPYLSDLFLEQEDGVVLDPATGHGDSGGPGPNNWPERHPSRPRPIRMMVVHLPHISNFTDVDPFKHEADVEVVFTRRAEEIRRADVIILPGTKNTIEDLIRIRMWGLEPSIRRVHQTGGTVIGICGGFQMLGRTIRDPGRVESRHARIDGLGLLDIETTLAAEKVTAQVDVRPRMPWSTSMETIAGYEIHMGRSRRHPTQKPAFIIVKRDGNPVLEEDGAVSPDARVWGTYLHGLFEDDEFRAFFLDSVRKDGGGSCVSRQGYLQFREAAMDQIADVARKNLDVKRIYELF